MGITTEHLICCPWNAEIQDRGFIFDNLFLLKDLELKGARKQLLSYFGEVIWGLKWYWTQYANQDPPVKGKSNVKKSSNKAHVLILIIYGYANTSVEARKVYHKRVLKRRS